MKTRLFCLLSALFFALGCKPEPDDLFNDYARSVVKIKHEYVYKVDFGGELGARYFTDVETLNDMVEDHSELTPLTSFGTGFFVSGNGKIATNRHVVNHLDDAVAKKMLTSMKVQVDLLRLELEKQEQALNTQYDQYQYEIGYWENYLGCWFDQDCWNQVKQKKLEATQNANIVREQYQQVQLAKKICNWVEKYGIDNAEISTETLSLGIALHDTHHEQYVPCVLLRQSNEEDIDLAIMQTNSKTLPDSAEQYLQAGKRNRATASVETMNEPLIMIGYNYNLDENPGGNRAQLTDGKITQISDGVKIMHSINALPGSSGSPIFNEWGDLVAINYAGIRGENFNFGIVAKHLWDLLDKTN